LLLSAARHRDLLPSEVLSEATHSSLCTVLRVSFSSVCGVEVVILN
jgi:hypothetical protein